jgi:hypothetical protein
MKDENKETLSSWLRCQMFATDEAGRIGDKDTKQAVRALLYGMAGLTAAVLDLERSVRLMRDDFRDQAEKEDLRRSTIAASGGKP